MGLDALANELITTGIHITTGFLVSRGSSIDTLVRRPSVSRLKQAVKSFMEKPKLLSLGMSVLPDADLMLQAGYSAYLNLTGFATGIYPISLDALDAAGYPPLASRILTHRSFITHSPFFGIPLAFLMGYAAGYGSSRDKNAGVRYGLECAFQYGFTHIGLDLIHGQNICLFPFGRYEFPNQMPNSEVYLLQGLIVGCTILVPLLYKSIRGRAAEKGLTY